MYRSGENMSHSETESARRILSTGPFQSTRVTTLHIALLHRLLEENRAKLDESFVKATEKKWNFEGCADIHVSVVAPLKQPKSKEEVVEKQLKKELT
eukprot:CAMPEP_0196579304 /NCGR_PEP_ID=MMETSP1081-20130531/19846_1 /TAXON_ID=36882 /ORGANISM="Pyramimonas amylifera, Strain CCMP720" /LENGTH=96 /DNA_ID=CAMNT_0041898839 /DNA_START=1 /DNA_END=287 /DNA_ORIENTATION=-